MTRNSDTPFDAAGLIEVMAESVLVTTTDLDPPGPSIVYANAAFERMTGWQREEVLGRSPRLLQGAETDISVFHDLRSRLAAIQPWEGRAVNYRKDRSTFMMEWSIVPLRGTSGEIDFYVAVQRDVTARVKADRAIANLSRYFSPAVAGMLAERDEPFGPVRRQDLAVLFVDIVGFTGLAEAMQPEQVIALLRSFHKRVVRRVFEHDGTVEAYVGDAVVAVFGMPEARAADPGNALLCACALLDDVARWNAERRDQGVQALDIGVGAHFGPVVAGEVGTESSMAFTVIGDSVNIASRLQNLTRSLGHRLVIGDALRSGAMNDRRETVRKSVAGLTDGGPQALRGRVDSIRVWLAR